MREAEAIWKEKEDRATDPEATQILLLLCQSWCKGITLACCVVESQKSSWHCGWVPIPLVVVSAQLGASYVMTILL